MIQRSIERFLQNRQINKNVVQIKNILKYLIDAFKYLIILLKLTSNMPKKLISSCPICEKNLFISRLSCGSCDTQIDSKLTIPAFFKLPEELQEFVLVFLRCRGNIREAEKALGISYPTVCKKLDLVNELLGNQQSRNLNQNEILNRLERGEISAKEAAQLMKGRSENAA